jgi:thiol:disulfide interchange protein
LYSAEQQVVPAGKPAVLQLRFRVNEGFHVNSHTPKSELLIPTRVELDPDPAVKAAPAEYPAGQTFSFSFDPSEKVDVYAGSFIVKVPVTAARGPHELHGALKYQACDHAACYPPRTLAIAVPFTAK